MAWDVVECDFDGDETSNFGPRQESGTALYQIETFATVSSRDIPTKVTIPQVVSAVLNDKSCIAVDKHITLFDDCQFQITLALNYTVDKLQWSPDGNLLIIGDIDGNIYVVDAESKNIVFTKKLCNPTDFGNAFSQIKFSYTCESEFDLIILCADGNLMVFPKLSHELLMSVGQDASNLHLVMREKLKIIKTADLHTESVNDVICFDEGFITLGCGDRVLAVWTWQHGELELQEDMCSFLLNGAGILQGHKSSDGIFLFLLDTNNVVSLWDLQSLVILHVWSDIKVTEFQLLETKQMKNHSLEGMKLIVMSEPRNGHTTLNVLNLPNGEVVYSLQVNDPSKLALFHPSQEQFYIAECCGDSSFSNSITTVRFRCLTETNPETRWLRILQKGRFEEAEQFAKLFNLKVELVHQKRVAHLLEQLSPWNIYNDTDPEYISKLLEQLWMYMDQIKDDLFVVDTAMRTALPDMDSTQKLILYCKNRLKKFTSTKSEESNEKAEHLQKLLCDIENRLVTMELAFGRQAYKGEIWRRFLKVNLLQECFTIFENGFFIAGLIIWIRHEHEWNNFISDEALDKFLSWIPESVSANEVLGLMRDRMVPMLARLQPTSLVKLSRWIIAKAKHMELLEREHWPLNAIKFLKCIERGLCKCMEMKHNEYTCSAVDTANKTQISVKDVVEPVHKLIADLQHLHDLHTKYNCKLSYGQFVEETTETVVFRMLDRVVALEMINKTLDNQIRPYIKEHGLKENYIFSKYIKDLLERQGGVKSYCIDEVQMWEPKALAVINCIDDQEGFVNAILELIKCAPIPWSKDIESIIQKGMEMQHPKVTLLKKECILANVKKIMLKYGWRNQNSSGEQLWKFILSQNVEGCMEDAIKVMEAFNIPVTVHFYMFRLRYLLHRDQVSTIVKMLRGLDTSLAITCSKHIIQYAITIIDDPLEIDVQKRRALKRNCTEAAMYIIKVFLMEMLEDSEEVEEFKALLENLKYVKSLQCEYDIFPTLAQYQDACYRKSLLISYSTEFFLQRAQQENSAKYVKLYRIADLLQVPRIDLQGELAMEALRNGDYVTALKMCRWYLSDLYMSEANQSTSRMLYRLALAFMKLQASVQSDENANRLRDLPAITHKLACRALTFSNYEERYLNLCKVTALNMLVASHCEVSEVALEQKILEFEPDIPFDPEFFNENSVDNNYKEDAIVMSSCVILPLVSKYALSISNMMDLDLRDEEADYMECVQEVCKDIVPLVEHLNYSHSILCHQYIMHMFSAVSSFITKLTQDEEDRFPKLSRALEEVKKLSEPWIKEVVSSILMKIFNHQKVDHTLGLSYLTSRPKREGQETLMKMIRSCGHNYKKLMAVATIGIGLGQMYKEPNMMNMCDTLEKNAMWGHRLAKVNISFKEAFQGPNSEKLKLLTKIAQYEAADMNVVRDFCKDFSLDVDEGLMLYLDNLFSHDTFTVLSLSAKRTKLNKATAAINAIKTKENLLDKLSKLYENCSAYDYETLEYLLLQMQQIEDNGSRRKALELIEYLKPYVRKKPPSDYEINYSSRQDKDNASISILVESLPAESKTRLPVHPFMSGDAWKILTPELDKDTVVKLLPVGQVLRLAQDQIYLSTVQNMVKKHVESMKKGGSMPAGDKSQWNWNIKDANTELQEDINHLLSNVHCKMALVCITWIVKELPMGAEKVQALRSSLKYAELWLKTAKDKNTEKEASEAVRRFKSTWQRLATEQVLFLNNMGTSEYLSLVTYAESLVIKLYEHPSILLQSHNELVDIHDIAKKVSKINNLDINKIRKTLLMKWLPSNVAKDSDADTTMTFSFDSLKLGEEAAIVSDADTDEQNLKRVLYLLQDGSLEENISYLWNFALLEEGQKVDNMTNMCRIRALRCILYIGDEEVIQKLLEISTEQIREYLRIFLYLVDLEKLHILHSIETFTETNKEGLVRGLWRNHKHQRTAALLAASLCLDYDINDKQLWTSILQSLLSFDMLGPLEYVLCRLSGSVNQLSCVAKMWQTILTSPLNKVMTPLTEEQKETCVQCFNKIIQCPVLSSIDLTALSKMYYKLDMPACSLGCMLMSTTADKNNLKNLVAGKEKSLLLNAQHLLDYGLDLCLMKKIQEFVSALDGYDMCAVENGHVQ